jgi:hypothetical protein
MAREEADPVTWMEFDKVWNPKNTKNEEEVI